MADDDVPDYEFDEGETLEWFFVEDDFPLVDELAESQIPDPGYAGTNAEIEMDAFSFDLYEFWDDLEYGQDEYWDHSGTRQTDAQTHSAGSKRKRNASGMAKRDDKRRKLSLSDTAGDNISFVSSARRQGMAEELPPHVDRRAVFALLPDWKERFADDSDLLLSKAMPADMKRAAEAVDEDTPSKQKPVNAEVEMAEDEAWEDEDEDEGEDGEADLQAELASLDPEMVKGILKQKLGDAGLEGMDEGAFMETISKMLSGQGNADDAAGNLASSLLGQATQGNDTALSGWLSGQGISLDAAEEDDEASSVATTELPGAASGNMNGTQDSPSDSAVDVSKGPAGGATSELAIHTGSSPTASGKKRMAPRDDDAREGTKKRKKVTFDVPASSDPAAGYEVAEDEDQDDPEKSEPATSEDPLISENTVHEEAEKSELPTSEDPLLSETTIYDGKTRVTKTRATKTATTKNNKAKPGNSTSAKRAQTTKLETKAEAVTANNLETPAPPKNARKRKAEANGDDVENLAPMQKKQAKKGSSSASLEVPGRRKRSTRAGTEATPPDV